MIKNMKFEMKKTKAIKVFLISHNSHDQLIVRTGRYPTHMII